MRSFISSFLFLATSLLPADNVGLLVTATGRYIEFIEPLVNSAKKHFLKGHKVTFFVFTDSVRPKTEDIVWLPHKQIGWPYDTLMRFHIYLQNRKVLEKQDFLFACDADMLFVGDVGDEILSKRVATEHPGFVGKRGSYEENPLSKACMHKSEGKYYFAGGFYGGTAAEVLKLCKINAHNIDDDLGRGIIAVWHDESHLNRYFVDHLPTKILTPSYCYPESWNLPYKKRLLALDKNHSEYRK